MTHVTRRGFLAGSASLLGLMGTVPHALAQVWQSERRFLFVFAQGGWDPTRVFAPGFGNPNVSMEATAALSTQGDLTWVSDPSRPAVDSFFDAHGTRSLIVNGIMVPSVQHEICTQLMLTGRAVNGLADWGSIIAARGPSSYTLPHLVAGGPAFPGPHTASVARTGSNGQLDGLLTGAVLGRSVMPTGRLSKPAEALVDRYLARRAGGRLLAAEGTPDAPAIEVFDAAIAKAEALEELRYDTNLRGGASLGEQLTTAVDALSKGISRCVSVSHTGGVGGWDSHGDNDATQAALFEDLFTELGRLMDTLARTPGANANTMADEVVVVVVSEMGRTPLLNNALGKDHWPYTSAMIVGPGITGGRVVGGYDDAWFGAPLNPLGATIDPGGVRIGAGTLGATLLALADLDPEEHLPGVPVLRDVIL